MLIAFSSEACIDKILKWAEMKKNVRMEIKTAINIHIKHTTTVKKIISKKILDGFKGENKKLTSIT